MTTRPSGGLIVRPSSTTDNNVTAATAALTYETDGVGTIHHLYAPQAAATAEQYAALLATLPTN